MGTHPPEGHTRLHHFAIVYPDRRELAGDEDLRVAGGANVIQPFIEAGLLDELQVHLASVLLGDEVRLFDGISAQHVESESTRVIGSHRVTHLGYRILR